MDPDRFIAKYFTTDGRPDPTKTKQVMKLWLYEDSAWTTKQCSPALKKLQKVPGLHFGSPRPGTPAVAGASGATYVGWDKDKVDWFARVEFNRANQRLQEKQRIWADALTTSRELKAELIKNRPRFVYELSRDETDARNLRRWIGSWTLAPGAAMQWNGQNSHFFLDIGEGPNPQTLAGTLRTSCFEGTVLISLGLRWRSLIEYAERADWSLDASLSPEEIKARESRLFMDIGRPDPATKLRRAANPWTKERFPAEIWAHIVLRGQKLRCDGLESGEIETAIHSGNLRFTDEKTFCEMEGVISVPFLGPKIEIKGNRVSNEPLMTPKGWDTYAPRRVQV